MMYYLGMQERGTVYQSAVDIGQAFAALTRGPAVQRRFDELRHLAGVDLDRPAFVVLDVLDVQGAMRVSELAEACGVDISTVSRLVARLKRSGMVAARQIEGDRRVVLLEVTPEGVARSRRLKAARRNHLAAFLCKWTAEERATFAQLLARFVEDLDAQPVTASGGTEGTEE